MMRSLYSAVSGLNTHQTKMDVIGNNIANVNTQAFKSSSVRFSEIMYQTTATASSGGGATGKGGVNPKQIGLGVAAGSTTVSITSAGASETTGNPFDLKLTDTNSTNFFIVSDGTNTFFTRAGDFYIDGNGYMCMSSTGYKLQGWPVDENGNIIVGEVGALQLMRPENQTSSPEATTYGKVTGVLDKNDANAADKGRIINLGFYDELGYNYTAMFSIKNNKNETDGSKLDGDYSVNLTDILDSNGKSIFAMDDYGNYIDNDGNVIDAADTKRYYNGEEYDLTDLFNSSNLLFDQSDGSFKSIKPVAGDAGGAGGAGTGGAADGTDDATRFDTITLNLSLLKTTRGEQNNKPSNFSDIVIDFSGTMNYNNNGTSTISGKSGDAEGEGAGKALGALTGVAVNSDGRIYGSYDNGNTVLLGQISVAQFANASGLEKVGENCYKTTLNSGEFDGIGVAISADGSSIASGTLEMSNVDLAGQFTDMVITQRGFQANSRVITTSDTLLEELINLKR